MAEGGGELPLLGVYVLFVLALEVWEQFLNHRQLKVYERKRPVNKNVLSIVTEEQYKQINMYSKDKMRFNIVSSIFHSIVSMALTVMFVYPWIWRTVGEALGTKPEEGIWGEYKQSLVFVALCMVESEIVRLPFSLYYDFVIEEKHGFNKKTLGLFCLDTLKTWLLTSLLGTPILFVTIWIVYWGGRSFYIWLWCVSVVVSGLLMIIYPNLIAPLFNKFENLKDEQLKTKIEQLSSELKFPLGKLYQIDGSTRSSHSNAYFYGFWWCKQIVLYDTLLHLSHDKILAILGHELGHWKLNHTLHMMMASFGQMFTFFYLYGLCMYNDNMYASFGYDPNNKAVVIGFSLFCSLISPVNALTALAMTLLTRRNEFQADEFSHGLGFSEPLQGGLVDIHKENKACLDPDSWYSWYHYTHPPLLERLDALRLLDKQVK
eukprot:GHVS01094047.1.p1 GENE.GHVS01094047.1~~GHVS01094047.1.p1  ORF type:complete len:432 (+),score=56.92 GHVS01094047.1:45-1340(+)